MHALVYIDTQNLVYREEKNPKNINVNEIGKPTKIANNITATNIKPRVAGLIISAIIFD